jgi:hypothetical protein
MDFRIVCVFFLLGVVACKEKLTLTENGNKVIAKAEDKVLSQADLAGLAPKGTSAADSMDIINRYVDSWVKKQLLLTRAEQEVEFDEAEIERKILEYRYALMVYEYEKQYIHKHLDTIVSPKEIADYYKNNLANFELKQNIVQGYLAAIPLKAPKLDKAKNQIQSVRLQDSKEFKSYCYRFASFYSLEDSTWFNFEDLIRNTPFKDISNKVQFLKENKYAETKDDKNVYLLSIRQYKISSQTSPLDYVAQQIKDIILNKRKVSLTQELERKIYEEAKNKKKFEIYTK